MKRGIESVKRDMDTAPAPLLDLRSQAFQQGLDVSPLDAGPNRIGKYRSQGSLMLSHFMNDTI